MKTLASENHSLILNLEQKKFSAKWILGIKLFVVTDWNSWVIIKKGVASGSNFPVKREQGAGFTGSTLRFGIWEARK